MTDFNQCAVFFILVGFLNFSACQGTGIPPGSVKPLPREGSSLKGPPKGSSHLPPPPAVKPIGEKVRVFSEIGSSHLPPPLVAAPASSEIPLCLKQKEKCVWVYKSIGSWYVPCLFRKDGTLDKGEDEKLIKIHAQQEKQMNKMDQELKKAGVKIYSGSPKRKFPEDFTLDPLRPWFDPLCGTPTDYSAEFIIDQSHWQKAENLGYKKCPFTPNCFFEQVL